MALRGRNPVGYGWEMWEWQLLVGDIYIILYICRGYEFATLNPPRETQRVVETRRGTSLRRVRIVGLFWRRATARLYVGNIHIGYIYYTYVGNILLSVISKKIPLENQ